MAESSTTHTQSSNFPSGTGKNFLQVSEKVDKVVRLQGSCNGRSDVRTAALSVSTKPPRRKKSLLESLRKSFSEFRYGPKSEGSENDRESQHERCDNKEPEVREAEVVGTSVLGPSSNRNKVDSCSSLPDAVEKFFSSHDTSFGFKRGQDYIFDVSGFGNEVDKIGLSLFDIVQNSKLQAVTVQRKVEEDWGLELGSRESSDLTRSPSMKKQHETNNQENTGLDLNLNNCPDSGRNLGLKCSITVPGTPGNSSSPETPNPRPRGRQPRHGVYIIGLNEGGVAKKCGELAVEDLIIEVNGIMVLNHSAESVTAAMEQITSVNLVVARKRDT